MVFITSDPIQDRMGR